MSKRTLSLILTGAIAFATAAKTTQRNIEKTTAEMVKTNKNMQLDVLAIARAGEVVNRLVESGEITSIDELSARLSSEVAFQKIAIREK